MLASMIIWTIFMDTFFSTSTDWALAQVMDASPMAEAARVIFRENIVGSWLTMG
jgi:hypothetical protein